MTALTRRAGRRRATFALVEKARAIALFALPLAGIVILWKAVTVALQVPDFIVPAPEDVVRDLWTKPDVFMRHGWSTLQAVLAGFGIAVVLGVPLAMGMAFSPLLDRLMSPVLVAAQAVPKVAVAPIIVMWLGFGFRSTIAVAASIAIFPIVVNTALGLRDIDPDLIRLGRSMGGSPRRLFMKIRLPKALPNVFAGLKLAISFAVIGTVVGEFIAGSSGLGYLIQLASGQLQTVRAFAGIASISLMAIALYYLVELVERFALRWHPSQDVQVSA